MSFFHSSLITKDKIQMSKLENYSHLFEFFEESFSVILFIFPAEKKKNWKKAKLKFNEAELRYFPNPKTDKGRNIQYPVLVIEI